MAVAHLELVDPSAVEPNHLPEIDGSALRAAHRVLKAFVRTYHRAESTGVEKIPDGGVLLIGNHSGGVFAMDVPVIVVPFWDHFGLERPFHVLAHDVITKGPLAPLLRPFGFVNANREAAAQALAAGGVTVLFPGGDFDATRPWHQANKIDFAGRTGYVRTALDAGVPIVPVVSIGGHETQLILSRGEWLAKVNPFNKLFRSTVAPIAVGLSGISIAVPSQIPLPSKIVTSFLDPIDIRAEFGDDPDIAAVDAEIRARMQVELDKLAAARRFPVIG